MGDRCDQFVGLPLAARAFLAEHEVPPEFCECCDRPYRFHQFQRVEEIGFHEGLSFDRYPLTRHVLTDGRTADVFHQASGWRRGPVHHYGLRVSDGTEFVWTNEEIRINSQ